MLRIVAVNVMAVIASFRTNVAVPNDDGLGTPPNVVSVCVGFSWSFVRWFARFVFSTSWNRGFVWVPAAPDESTSSFDQRAAFLEILDEH